MEFFTAELIEDRVVRIRDITGVFLYLVKGNRKALLIDTGCGIGDIKTYVEGLTDLPLTVVCTHGHMDHAGGADQFEDVYLNQADWELTFTHCSVNNRIEYAKFSCAVLHPEIGPGQIEAWEYSKIRTRDYQELCGGMEFDLGGITVQTIPLLGHTHGSMCMLFKERRSLLMGDTCNPSVFLFDQEALTVEEYRENLIHFRKYEPLYDRIWLSHGDGNPMPKKLIEECICVCDTILSGTDDKEDFAFMGNIWKAAFEMFPNQLRKDGGLANIIYNPQKIRRGVRK